MQMEAETNSPEDASAMAFGLHQVTHQTRAENVLPAETLIEVQNQENTTNLERETTEINSTNDSEEQEKVPVLHTGEELENDDGGKFKQEKAKDEATKMQLLETATDSPLEDKVQSTTPTFEIVKGDTEEILQSPQKNDEVAVIDKSSTKDNNLEDDVQFDIEEAKVIEEATRTKLLNTATEILPVEEVQPRLPTPTIVQHIIQQQPLHQDESEANDNAMNCTAESKFDRISTVAEEPGEAETKESIGIVKEEQADHQSEVQVSSESSTKLSDHVNINEKKTVESCSAENLNNNEAIEITVEEATNAKHPTDVEIPKSATEDEAMQTKTNKESVKTEEVNESSQEERQPEAEIAEKFNKEGQTPQYDTKCPKINTTNHEEQKVVASHSMDKLGIEDDGKLDQEEAKGIEASHSMDKLGIEDDGKLDQEEAKGIEATKTKLPEEEVLTTLPTPAFVQIDTNQILQQLSPHNDESDVINKAKKSSFPEIERNGMSTVVEELVKPENAENIGIEKQEQADHLAEKSCKHETIESHSVENLEDIDATEITAEETDAKESIDVEIPKSEAEGVSKDNTLQTIPNTKSVGNEIVEESSQEESQAEAESSVKFNKEVQTTQCDTKETTKINTTNNTEQHEVPVSHAREKLGIDDDGTFDEEEARGTEEAAKMQLPEEEVLTTLPTPAFVQVDTDKNLQQQSLHNDELEAINIAQKGCLPEIKPDGMSTILEELERPENQDNMRKEKEEQKDHQVDKSNEQNDNTNYMIAEGHNTSESSTKLSGDFDSEEHKIIELHSVENLEDLDVTKIVAEIETAKQSTDVEIPKSETEDDNTLQSIANTELVRNKSVEQSSQEEREQEAESSAKFNKAVQTIEYDIEETANTTNDTEQREEFPACAKEKLGIVGKFNQEARGIEEVTKNQLPRKEVQATLPTPAIVQGDNDQILQKQTLHNDEPQAIDNTKKSNLELEPDGMSMVVEELEKPEIQENVNIDKEEQANLQVEESSEQTDIINYVTAEVPAFHAKEKLGIKDDEKFNEEAREIEEATKMQLADEEIQTTLLPPTFVQVDRDCILQQITLHIDELEAIDNAKKNSIPEIEPDGMSTVVQELEKPENPDISIEKEEQAGHKVAESSMQTQNIDYIEAEGCITRESSTKLSDDIDISGHKKVESHSAENLEEMDTKEITAEEATDVKQSTDVEKPKSETEGLPKDNALQTISNTGFSGNEDVDENNKKGRQLAAVVTEKFKPQCDTKETDETNTTNYIEKQEQVQAPHTHDKLEIKDDGKIDQEEDKGILEETITQLQEEAVQTTLPTPAIFQGDTDKISQQQTLHDDESEANDNDKSCILEIQLEGKSIIVEESEKSENKDNIGIEKEEQAEGYSVQNAITNYIIAEGPVTSQSSTKLSDDVDFDEQKTIESRSIQNLENMDASETTAEESPDAKILTDVEMPTKETKGAPEDKALQTIPNKGSVRNELVNESTQEVRRPEAEFTEKFNKELQTPPHDTEETTKINTTNDIMEQEEVQATYTKEKLEIEDHGKFYPKEEARVIEETEKTKLSDIELQTTLSIPTLVRCDTDHISQQQTLHDDESDTIDNANKSCIPEIELQEKSTVIEELEKPENDVCIEKEAAYQVEELDMQNDITNYITAKGPVTSEISTKLNDVDVDQQKTIESHSIENLENMDASEITAEEATNAKQSIDVEITKSEIEDKALKTMPNVASVRNGAVDEGRHKETQPEGEFTEKTNREVQTGPPQEVLRASHAKEKLGVEEDKKFDQEIKTQLTEQKVQTLHNDELEGIIDNAKLGKPEIELDGKSTFVEDHEKPETMENDSKVKEEQAYCQSEESSMSTVIINYVTTEGCFTSESSTKLSDDIKVNEQKIVDSHLVENLETKNASEITADEATDAIQSTDMEIPKSETEVLSEDKALQSIPNTWSVENELVDESTQEERQPEAEFKEKINKEMHTPKYYTKETGKIITTNETQEQEVRASHVKEKLGIEDDGKFNQEVEGTEEEKKMQLPGQEVQTTLPTNKILQQQTLHNDETKVIDNAKSCIPEIELDQKSTVVEEIEQPETKENDSIVKEEQAYHISGEASVPTVITNSVTVEGHNSSESSRKSSDDVDVNQTKTADLHSVENLEKKNPSDITAEEAANAIQSTDLEIPELETQDSGVGSDVGSDVDSGACSGVSSGRFDGGGSGKLGGGSGVGGVRRQLGRLLR
ncbi:hypothetical protein VNO78_16290 [Psophocarpus tetragonolobus]|uniref:Uncharacterized protein n=1 Tax=Psophocarpus tetragonolobus TaxID=3891 RepID=A0AAN9SL26_PSOTE